MQRPVPKEKIKGLECKHVVYAPAQDDSSDDVLVIKENIHTVDGEIIPNLHFIKNYQRAFWVTKEGHRNHEQKKEWEDLNKLQKFTTTQGQLLDSIRKALGRPGLKGGLRQLARSPYLYGTDISTPTLLKQQYHQRFPNTVSINTVAVIDIETDVVYETQRPVYVGITYRNKAYLATTEEFMAGVKDPVAQLHRKFKELLGDIAETRDIELEVQVCRDAGEACYQAMMRAHEWQPDFLTVWNMDFDIPRIADCLNMHGYNLADVFSDPRVPPKYRFYKYKQGPNQKRTASGLVTPIHPADRWHVAECPASFFIIDSMCVYKRIRTAEPNDNKYTLDFQLEKHLGQRKLKFDDLVKSQGGTLDWHIEMQTDYKIEYGIYNLFDCIGVELFDDKVRDLAQTISVQCGVSEYSIFNSQPKRLVDQLYYFVLEEHNKIVGSCSDDMDDGLTEYSLPLSNWIVTLPSHLRTDQGLKVISELPAISTEIYGHVADLDLAAGYPTIEQICNISKETTFRELSRIKGIDTQVQRLQGINLNAGPTNAYEFATTILRAPTFDQILADFEVAIHDRH